MSPTEFFQVIATISGLLFVVTSMLSMGMSLTIAMIIKPLKDMSLVVRALLANFVLVPVLAYLILLLIPLDQSLGIGFIVLACAAGAPFLPKLVQGAKGDVLHIRTSHSPVRGNGHLRQRDERRDTAEDMDTVDDHALDRNWRPLYAG